MEKTAPSKTCARQKVTDLGRYYYDSEAAERVVHFFDTFVPHTTGPSAGQPFKLLEWQKDMLRELFGWRRKKDGFRRFRRLFLEVPKKNGKSTISAGLALYLTAFDGEYNAKTFCAATDKEQARIVFDEARTMVELSPNLGEVFSIVKNCITCEETRSTFVPVSSESKGRHGINAHAVIFDELHALRDPELYEVMTRGSGAARKQPLQISITTAGSDKTSICYAEYEHAKEVIKDETKDEQLLAYIFEPEPGDSWHDPAVWAKVNPSVGRTLPLEFLEQEYKLARQNPRNENTFRQLHLNQWVSQVTRWYSMEEWNKCAAIYGETERAGQLCFGGLDLSSTLDLTAFVLAFPVDDLLYLLPKLYIPADRVQEASRRDNVPYGRWVAEGYMTATPGNVIDYDVIMGDMVEASKLFSLQDIGYDPYNATKLVTDAEKLGLKMVPVTQNFSGINAACKEFERRLMQGTLRHPNNPVLNWCADNIEVRTGPGGVIAPNKPAQRGGKQKRIDGVVASIIALDRVIRNKGADTQVPDISFL